MLAHLLPCGLELQLIASAATVLALVWNYIKTRRHK